MTTKRKYTKKVKVQHDPTLTSEFKISAFLFSLYIALKQNPKTSVIGKAKEFSLGQMVIEAAKELNIIKTNGKTGGAVEWLYIGPQPNEATAKKVFDKYTELLKSSVQRIRSAAPYVPVGKKSIFDTEAVQILNDKLDTIIDQNIKLLALWETPLSVSANG